MQKASEQLTKTDYKLLLAFCKNTIETYTIGTRYRNSAEVIRDKLIKLIDKQS